jgi:hypothetical protein
MAANEPSKMGQAVTQGIERQVGGARTQLAGEQQATAAKIGEAVGSAREAKDTALSAVGQLTGKPVQAQATAPVEDAGSAISKGLDISYKGPDQLSNQANLAGRARELQGVAGATRDEQGRATLAAKHLGTQGKAQGVRDFDSMMLAGSKEALQSLARKGLEARGFGAELGTAQRDVEGAATVASGTVENLRTKLRDDVDAATTGFRKDLDNELGKLKSDLEAGKRFANVDDAMASLQSQLGPGFDQANQLYDLNRIAQDMVAGRTDALQRVLDTGAMNLANLSPEKRDNLVTLLRAQGRDMEAQQIAGMQAANTESQLSGFMNPAMVQELISSPEYTQNMQIEQQFGGTDQMNRMSAIESSTGKPLYQHVIDHQKDFLQKSNTPGFVNTVKIMLGPNYSSELNSARARMMAQVGDPAKTAPQNRARLQARLDDLVSKELGKAALVRAQQLQSSLESYNVNKQAIANRTGSQYLRPQPLANQGGIRFNV